MSFTFIKTQNLIILLGLLSATSFYSCEESLDPSDPDYFLNAPFLLSAEALTDSRIEISWKDKEEETREFVIQRQLPPASFSVIGIVDKNILTFIDTACVAGMEYSYVVQSKVESNESEFSNTRKMATTFLAPGHLNVLVLTDESVRLTWRYNSAFETGFKVERDAGAGFINIGTVPSNITEFTDTGLTPGHNYNYRIAAYSTINTSTWATVTTATEFPAPSNLRASSASDIAIRLTWEDDTDFEEGFKIERDNGNGFIEVGTVGADEVEYTDSGVTLGQATTYRVAGYTQENMSPWNTVTMTTVFPAPINFSANSVSDIEIHLTWSDRTDFEEGFKIERDTGDGYVEVETVSADVLEFTDSGLTLGQTYAYRVAGYTSENIGEWTTVSMATVFPSPSNLISNSFSELEIRLTWTDNTDFELGFMIERDSGIGWEQIAVVEADKTDFTDFVSVLESTHSYRVRAHSASNNSAYSNVTTRSALAPLSDYDGNEYQVIRIGDQVWMAENLKVTHYRDGTAIPNATDLSWGFLTTGAYDIYYNNSSNEVDTYGALYNWYAAADLHNIAPAGWHVPTDSEWTELNTFLSNNGHNGTQGAALKSTYGWRWTGSYGGTDDYGFEALPAGFRISEGYYGMLTDARFWSATGSSSYAAVLLTLDYSNSVITRYENFDMRLGASIRLVRD
ncbi:MAG: hypothetical protein HQ556_00115 [Candidatus Marinimicrobia bacterium]|nr:hypothetical protein [Candidatus Neomarinimicrobiota bacterium]